MAVLGGLKAYIDSMRYLLSSLVAIISIISASAAPLMAAATQTAQLAPATPDDSVPLCAGHDPAVYHALYDASRNCHYDHEHHDNPHTADIVFGDPGAWYGAPEQTISYPWQTMNASTGALENMVKHEGYKWLVETNSGCTHRFTDNPGCITDYRIEVHALATVADATVRYHSFQAEINGCIGNDCGTIRTGGWHDYGHLFVLGPDGNSKQCVNLPGDPCILDASLDQPQKTHSGLAHAAYFANWYGAFSLVTAQLHLQEYGPIDPANPSHQQQFQAPGAHNGSQMRIENLTIILDPNDPWVQRHTDTTGHVTFHGYADRYGHPVDGCTTVGLDCVPLLIDNLPAGRYWWRGDPASTGDNGRDYDTSPLRQGTGQAEWIGSSN